MLFGVSDVRGRRNICDLRISLSISWRKFRYKFFYPLYSLWGKLFLDILHYLSYIIHSYTVIIIIITCSVLKVLNYLFIMIIDYLKNIFRASSSLSSLKCLSISFKKYFPTFILASLQNEGLNHIIFVFLFLRPFSLFFSLLLSLGIFSSL